MLSESLRFAKERGSDTTLDGTFGRDLEAGANRWSGGISARWWLERPSVGLPTTWFLDSFQTRISHAFVQKVVDIRPNRTGIDSAVGYFVTPRFAIQFVETLQVTHDGIDWLVPGGLAVHNGATLTQDHRRNHDRLGRANALNLGAGVSFSLTEDVNVFGTVTKLAWGENLTPPRSVTVGMNWSFHMRRGAASAPSLAPRARSRGGH